MAERVEVKEAVANFVQANGLKELTMAKVVEGVRPSLPNVKLDPSHISQVLRQDLNLRFFRKNCHWYCFRESCLMWLSSIEMMSAPSRRNCERSLLTQSRL